MVGKAEVVNLGLGRKESILECFGFGVTAYISIQVLSTSCFEWKRFLLLRIRYLLLCYDWNILILNLLGIGSYFDL